MTKQNSDTKFSLSGLFKLVLTFVKPFTMLFIVTVILNTLFSIFNTLSIGLVKPVFTIIFNVERNTIPKENLNFLEKIERGFYSNVESMIISQDGLSQTLINLGLLIVIMFIIKNFFKYLSSVTTTKLEEGIIKHIRDSVFGRMISLSVDFYERNKEGSLMSVITNDIQTLNGTTIASISIILRELVQIVLFMILLFGISIKLSLIAFSTSIISLIIIRLSMKYLRRYASRMQAAMADYTSTMQEIISGIRIVKAYIAEKHANSRFMKDTSKYVSSAVKHQKIITLIPAINELSAISALCIVLLIGGSEVLSGKMNSDDLMAFLFFLFAIMSPIATVINSIAQYQRGSVAAERVAEVLNAPITIQPGNKLVGDFNKELELKNINFSYNSNLVIKNVSFSVPYSKRVALVGPSGSGKSTMLDLIIRFYDPISGNILIDGTDIKDYSVESYRRLFGIVSQESMLFNDTIKNNIRFGSDEISDEKVIEAAKLANAYNFIMKLPEAFDTFIGDRGVLLSGGEKQRLSIARALARNPKILIFDEATSSLDAESEKVVQEAISHSLKNRTAIIVAHRLSTIIDADMILVFNDGQIAEKGSHNELISQNGIYKKLYDMQFSRK